MLSAWVGAGIGVTVAAPLGRYVLRVRGGVGTPAPSERRWRGEVCLVAAVAALYLLTGGDRILYGIPILTLTFADTAAGFVGTRYGRTGIPLDTGKSFEGSIAFFVVAAVCALMPLMMAAAHRPSDAARMALVYAAIVTAVEAVSSGGIDNLSVPLVGYFAMSALVKHDPMALRGVMYVATLLVGAMAVRRFFAAGWSTAVAGQ